MTYTKSLLLSNEVICEKIVIRAADVDLVGSYANWLDRSSEESTVGIMYLLTTNLYVKRDRMGTTEIGLIWEGSVALGIFGTGCTAATFHWRGTAEHANDKLIAKVSGFDMIGAASLRNQPAGKIVGPACSSLKLIEKVKYWELFNEWGAVLATKF